MAPPKSIGFFHFLEEVSAPEIEASSAMIAICEIEVFIVLGPFSLKAFEIVNE